MACSLDSPIKIQFLCDTNPNAMGIAIILTNDYKGNLLYEDLNATESDGLAMEDALTYLGYAVVRKHNVTLALAVSILGQLEEVNYPPSFRRLVFVFAGHGREQDGTQLITCDGRTLSMKTILSKASPSRDHSKLGSMVRLFFIDACRGSQKDSGIMIHRGGELASEFRIPSAVSNCIVCYSTIPGFRSYEINDENGSRGIWLPLVARNLKRCNKSIGEVLTHVNQELLQQFQDSKMYSRVMQPEFVQRLNENVNLLEEFVSRQGGEKVHVHATTPETVNPPSISEQVHVHSPMQDLSRSTSLPAPSNGRTHRPDGAVVAPLPLSLPPQQPLALVPNPICHQQATAIVARDSPVVAKGEYRGLLNQYEQKGIINKPKWLKCSESYDETQKCTVYRASVECTLVNNSTVVIGDSKVYYSGKKGVAQEVAAKDAVKQINSFLSCPNLCSSQLQVNSQLPQQVQTVSPLTEIALTSKRDLNNYFQGELRLPLPGFNTSHLPSGGFQCTITHYKIGLVKGEIRQSKREAEESAAKLALKRLGKF